MKYGMPALVEFKSIKENVQFAKENNFSFIELNMNIPYCFELKKNELQKYDFDFTMHLTEEFNIGELNNSLRKKYLKEIKKQIKLGISNNIKRYTIHLNAGTYFTLPTGKIFINNIYIKKYKANIKKSLDILNKIAKKYNIYINFENTNIFDFTKVAIDLINKYDYLGFTLDIGHNEKDESKALNLFKNKIRHIHMHDYNGKSDHLTINTGNIDFTKYKEYMNNNYVLIEVKESNELIKSLKNINKIIC